MSFSLASTDLHHELMSERRDAMYRAMSYLTRQGGPQISAPVDDAANLKAHRGSMLAWLEARQDAERLAREYIAYRERWSPIFKD